MREGVNLFSFHFFQLSSAMNPCLYHLPILHPQYSALPESNIESQYGTYFSYMVSGVHTIEWDGRRRYSWPFSEDKVRDPVCPNYPTGFH